MPKQPSLNPNATKLNIVETDRRSDLQLLGSDLSKYWDSILNPNYTRNKLNISGSFNPEVNVGWDGGPKINPNFGGNIQSNYKLNKNVNLSGGLNFGSSISDTPTSQPYWAGVNLKFQNKGNVEKTKEDTDWTGTTQGNVESYTDQTLNALLKLKNAGYDSTTIQSLYETFLVESSGGIDPKAGANTMQIMPEGFQATQDIKSHPNLKSWHKKYLEDFGIDWSNVSHEDVKSDPLLGVLAARLHMANDPNPIGKTIEDRASQWSLKYNTSDDPKGTSTYYLDKIKEIQKAYPNIKYQNKGEVNIGAEISPEIRAGNFCGSLTGCGQGKSPFNIIPSVEASYNTNSKNINTGYGAGIGFNTNADERGFESILSYKKRNAFDTQGYDAVTPIGKGTDNLSLSLGMGRRSETAPYRYGVNTEYDLTNKKLSNIGLYGQYGKLKGSLGYNPTTKGVSIGAGFKFQEGGLVNKYQDGSEVKYPNVTGHYNFNTDESRGIGLEGAPMGSSGTFTWGYKDARVLEGRQSYPVAVYADGVYQGVLKPGGKLITNPAFRVDEIPMGYQPPQSTMQYLASKAPKQKTDMTSKYNTGLSEDDQKLYNIFEQSFGVTEDDKKDYDVQGLFASGDYKDTVAWESDKFKKPNHPTFSAESIYNEIDGNQGGEYSSDEEFEPSATNMKYNTVDDLINHLSTSGMKLKLAPYFQEAANVGPDRNKQYSDNADRVGYLRTLRQSAQYGGDVYNKADKELREVLVNNRDIRTGIESDGQYENKMKSLGVKKYQFEGIVLPPDYPSFSGNDQTFIGTPTETGLSSEASEEFQEAHRNEYIRTHPGEYHPGSENWKTLDVYQKVSQLGNIIGTDLLHIPKFAFTLQLPKPEDYNENVDWDGRIKSALEAVTYAGAGELFGAGMGWAAKKLTPGVAAVESKISSVFKPAVEQTVSKTSTTSTTTGAGNYNYIYGDKANAFQVKPLEANNVHLRQLQNSANKDGIVKDEVLYKWIHGKNIPEKDRRILVDTYNKLNLEGKGINVTDFQKAVSDNIIPLKHTEIFVDAKGVYTPQKFGRMFSSKGVNNLGYETRPRDQLRKPGETPIEGILDNQTIAYSNRVGFGSGSTRHFDNAYTQGHARYIITKENPNTVTWVESQSDVGQGRGGYMTINKQYQDRILSTDKTGKSITVRDKNLANIQSSKNKIVELEKAHQKYLKDGTMMPEQLKFFRENQVPERLQPVYDSYMKGGGQGVLDAQGAADLQWILNKREAYFKDYFPTRIRNEQNRVLDSQAAVKGGDQKVDMLKNNFQRLFNENIKYTQELGKNSMRYPTPETTIKIQGYKKSGDNTITNFVNAQARYQEEQQTLDALSPSGWYKLKIKSTDHPELIELRDQYLQNIKMYKKQADKYRGLLHNVHPSIEVGKIAGTDRPMYGVRFDKKHEFGQNFQMPKDKRLTIKNDIRSETFQAEHQTIINKYNSKNISKMQKGSGQNMNYELVTDANGNTWYEWKLSNQNKTIRPHQHGGEVRKNNVFGYNYG